MYSLEGQYFGHSKSVTMQGMVARDLPCGSSCELNIPCTRGMVSDLLGGERGVEGTVVPVLKELKNRLCKQRIHISKM